MSGPQIPTFVQNVDAFAQAMGPTQADLVLDLAQVAWTTSAQRDDFINALMRKGGS